MDDDTDTDADAAAERILSRRSRPATPGRRAKRKKATPLSFARALFKITIMAGVAVGGIAIIIWFRNFAAASGIIWIGN